LARFFAGLDLGQSSEYTALAILEQDYSEGRTGYAVRHLQRWQPGSPYHAIALEIGRTLAAPKVGSCHLMIDRTGVGRPAAALFESVAGSVQSLVVSAGHAVSCGDDGSLHVPKKELVAVLQVLLQGRRLQVAGRLPLADMLVREMESFKAKIVPADAGPDLSWREQEHDDLVLAVAVAAWAGERTPADDGQPLIFHGTSPATWLRSW
jgi:hypothetical protein